MQQRRLLHSGQQPLHVRRPQHELPERHDVRERHLRQLRRHRRHVLPGRHLQRAGHDVRRQQHLRFVRRHRRTLLLPATRRLVQRRPHLRHERLLPVIRSRLEGDLAGKETIDRACAGPRADVDFCPRRRWREREAARPRALSASDEGVQPRPLRRRAIALYTGVRVARRSGVPVQYRAVLSNAAQAGGRCSRVSRLSTRGSGSAESHRSATADQGHGRRGGAAGSLQATDRDAAAGDRRDRATARRSRRLLTRAAALSHLALDHDRRGGRRRDRRRRRRARVRIVIEQRAVIDTRQLRRAAMKPISFLLTAALALSCSKSGTYVLVTVDSGTSFTLTSLNAIVSNSGQSASVTVKTGASFTIPPMQSFTLQIGSERSGDLTVEVHAIGSSGEVAQAKGTIALVPGGQATLALQLTPEISDMTTSDQSAADMGAAIQFAPAVGYQAFGAEYVAIADLRNDAKKDLMVGSFNDVGPTVLLGNGDGTFQAATTVNDASGPISIVAADFNGDGKPDLAVANVGAGVVSVHLGNGDGTFGMPSQLNVGSPGSLVTADFNGDLKPDLVTTDSGANKVNVFIGVGDGTFKAAVGYGTDLAPRAVVAADLNGDGKVDLVTANNGAGSMSVLMGNGDGTFVGAANRSLGVAPLHLVAARLDGDAAIDLAFVGGDFVSVLLGKGDGTFQAPINISAADSRSIAVGDIDGDQKPDLVTASFGNNQVDVLLGKGDGAFAAPIDIPAGSNPAFVAVGDLNGDGKPDLAVADHGSGEVAILINTTFK